MWFGFLVNLLGSPSLFKRRLLWASFLLAFGGAVWEVNDEFSGTSALRSPSEAVVDSHTYSGNAQSDQGVQPYRDPVALERPRWGNAALRIGVSLFIALVIGTIFRSFLKGAIIMAVVSVVILLVMERQGYLAPMWNEHLTFWESVGQWFLAQANAVRLFAVNYLPASTAAIVGLILGLRS
ncbi:MAG: hypothetical protein AAF226_19165 [Verrucomicrobiota bacterium]